MPSWPASRFATAASSSTSTNAPLREASTRSATVSSRLPAQARGQPRSAGGQGEPAARLGRHEQLKQSDHRFVPSAVFTDPQIAMVGLTENQARAQGYDVRSKVQDYGDVAYGWAMEDTTGIAKIIVDADSGKILGAHIMGHQASSLIQPLIQAMTLRPGAPGHGARPVLDPSGAAGAHRERLLGTLRRAAVAARPQALGLIRLRASSASRPARTATPQGRSPMRRRRARRSGTRRTRGSPIRLPPADPIGRRVGRPRVLPAR